MDKICWLFFLYENFRIVFQIYPETAKRVETAEAVKSPETARAVYIGIWCKKMEFFQIFII
tara:strand:- start:1966 stop:2148 length:183 start_codon:yes stop_codon:yes gene_type:complete